MGAGKLVDEVEACLDIFVKTGAWMESVRLLGVKQKTIHCVRLNVRLPGQAKGILSATQNCEKPIKLKCL